MKEHVDNEHTMQDCKVCNFKSRTSYGLNSHVDSMHNKMFVCKKCEFEATSSQVLKEHVKDNHSVEEIKTVFACNVCDYETIMENNLHDHKKYKHQEKRENVNKGYNGNRNVEIELCIYWNHGFCKHGDRCFYLHEEIPACCFQDSCRTNKCSLYHFNKSKNSFLGRSPVWKETQRHEINLKRKPGGGVGGEIKMVLKTQI